MWICGVSQRSFRGGARERDGRRQMDTIQCDANPFLGRGLIHEEGRPSKREKLPV